MSSEWVDPALRAVLDAGFPVSTLTDGRALVVVGGLAHLRRCVRAGWRGWLRGRAPFAPSLLTSPFPCPVCLLDDRAFASLVGAVGSAGHAAERAHRALTVLGAAPDVEAAADTLAPALCWALFATTPAAPAGAHPDHGPAMAQMADRIRAEVLRAAAQVRLAARAAQLPQRRVLFWRAHRLLDTRFAPHIDDALLRASRAAVTADREWVNAERGWMVATCPASTAAAAISVDARVYDLGPSDHPLPVEVWRVFDALLDDPYGDVRPAELLDAAQQITAPVPT